MKKGRRRDWITIIVAGSLLGVALVWEYWLCKYRRLKDED